MKQQDLLVGPPAKGAFRANKPADSAERRNGKRFAVSASAEVLKLRTRTRLSGRASDLGIGGCYVDTVSPFPAGTSLTIHLVSGSHDVQAKAAVIYAHTGMGMGLVFTEVNAEQRGKLRAWLRELGGEPLEDALAVVRMPGIEEPIAGAKSRGMIEAMHELISLLRNKRVLSEAEVEVPREKMTE